VLFIKYINWVQLVGIQIYNLDIAQIKNNTKKWNWWTSSEVEMRRPRQHKCSHHGDIMITHFRFLCSLKMVKVVTRSLCCLCVCVCPHFINTKFHTNHETWCKYYAAGLINFQQFVTTTWQTHGLIRWIMALMLILANPEIKYGNRLELDSQGTHNVT